MSLWSKPVESITYDDVNDFLLLKEREGPRLDYKADVPKDFHRRAAAFANTSGGLFVLGVDADKATNEPKWPRSTGDRGMDPAKGIDERIHQLCRDNIFPPVRPQTSPPIAIPGDSDHVLVVVRIDPSPEAPHATDSGRRIYERSGSVTEPIEFARVERIQQLLDRRRRLDEEREASIRLALERAVHQLGPRHLCAFTRARPDGAVSMEGAQRMFVPLRWCSVIPFYPWRELASTEVCHARHRMLPNVSFVQRVPGGTWGTAGIQHYSKGAKARSALTTKGHVFFIECAREAEYNWEMRQKKEDPAGSSDDFWLEFEALIELLKSTVRAARGFYKDPVELPGHLQLSIGFLDTRDYRMARQVYQGDTEPSDGRYRGGTFPDQTFRVDVVATMQEFLDSVDGPLNHLLDQVMDGFDLPRLPQGVPWSQVLG